MRNGVRGRTASARASTGAADLLPPNFPQRLRQWRAAVVDQTTTHPGRSLALAAGAGYLLGGGLFSALTGRILATGVRLGLRLALVPFMSQSVVALAEGLVSRESDGDDAPTVEDVSPDKKTGSHTRSKITNPARQTDNKETHS